MLKLFGLLFLSLGGALWGFEGARRLALREAELFEIYESADRLKGYVCRMREPLPVALRCAEGEKLHLFSDAAAAIESGKSAAAAFSGALDGASGALHLIGEDLRCLDRFAEGLSAPDIEGQERNISILLTEIEALRRAAREERLKKGKLYRVGGMLLGSLLGLFLW